MNVTGKDEVVVCPPIKPVRETIDWFNVSCTCSLSRYRLCLVSISYRPSCCLSGYLCECYTPFAEGLCDCSLGNGVGHAGLLQLIGTRHKIRLRSP